MFFFHRAPEEGSGRSVNGSGSGSGSDSGNGSGRMRNIRRSNK